MAKTEKTDNKDQKVEKSSKKSAKSSYSKKKKIKKNILNGIAYVQSTFNNTIISIADSNGNVTAFSGANVITGADSGATGTPSATASETADQITFTNGYASPELDHDSGEVLYMENRAPITRTADQTENVKLIIEF